MKKITAILLSCILMLSFASCSDSESGTSENIKTDKITDASGNTVTDNVGTADNTPSDNIGTTDNTPSDNIGTPDNTPNIPAEDTKVYAEAPDTREPEDEIVDGVTYDHDTTEIIEKGNVTVNIDGKDVTDICYVYVNKERKTSELAITSIMKEIGASVTWEEERAIISKDNLTLVLDISTPDFGIPQNPDSSHYVRKVINGEIVLDRESANPFIRAAGYSVKINYDAGIVNIVPLS